MTAQKIENDIKYRTRVLLKFESVGDQYQFDKGILFM